MVGWHVKDLLTKEPKKVVSYWVVEITVSLAEILKRQIVGRPLAAVNAVLFAKPERKLRVGRSLVVAEVVQ